MKLGIILAAGALVVGASAMAVGLNRGSGSSIGTYTELTGSSGAWSAIYQPNTGWTGVQTSGDQSNLTVNADVELWAVQTWDKTGIYFHQADSTNPTPAILSGTMKTNRGIYVGLSAPLKGTVPGDIHELVQTHDFQLNAVTNGAVIPLKWEGREGIGTYSDWRLPDSVDTPGANGTIPSAIWWRLGGPDGDHSTLGGSYIYQFKCTPTFAPYQVAGRYTLDPIVVTSPEL